MYANIVYKEQNTIHIHNHSHCYHFKCQLFCFDDTHYALVQWHMTIKMLWYNLILYLIYIQIKMSHWSKSIYELGIWKIHITTFLISWEVIGYVYMCTLCCVYISSKCSEFRASNRLFAAKRWFSECAQLLSYQSHMHILTLYFI